MEHTMKDVSKLDRLTKLQVLLRDCQHEAIKDIDEWMAFHDMREKVIDMLTDEKRRLGYSAVYPIVYSCSQKALYEGTKEECEIYIDNLIKTHPEMKGNIIVL